MAAASTSPSSGAEALIVAGGVYVEVCRTPPWLALFGSGGRAVSTLAALRDDIVLHTFHPSALADDVHANFRPACAEVIVHAAAERLTFDYLTPLSRPRIFPLPLTSSSVDVEGAMVLRFGCLEGDFRIAAKKAVYDPQSGSLPASFRANGSTADDLALVMNSNELRRLAGNDDLPQAAAAVMRSERAIVVVAKDGAAGAYVFEPASAHHVPAYPTETVFKIGSGDVFSAAFAHAWMSGVAAVEAADAASRRTAQYVANPVFPLPVELLPGAPASAEAGSRRVRMVAVGPPSTSHRWLWEEARRGLHDLGVATVSSSAGRSATQIVEETGDSAFGVTLILAGGEGETTLEIERAQSMGKPVVVFADDGAALRAARSMKVSVSDDLCSALYRCIWVEA
jgi:hypothetical protein